LPDYKQSSNMMLKDSYAALLTAPAYRPILHVAWIQAIGEESSGAPVHIKSTEGKLNGSFQLQRGKALQLIVDMEYTPGRSDSSGNSFYSDSITYRLNEKRSIQLNEVYYLDHPKFGVITKIKPL
ncbi:MAG: CsiV family protein, partial [Methylobacter sp.]